MSYAFPVQTYHRKSYPTISPSNLLTSPTTSLKGKTIFITGGASGIGLSTAKSLAAAGASHLLLLSRRPDVLAKAKHTIETLHPDTKVSTYSASIGDRVSVQRVFAEIRASAGEPDIIVLSAALAPSFNGPVLSLPADDLANVLNTNVAGNLYIVQEYLSVPSTAAKPKQIIDVSSSASYIRITGHSAYGPTKAAWTMLLEQVRAEAEKGNGTGEGVPQEGLRIMSLHPGSVFTEMAVRAGYSHDSPGVQWDDPELAGDFITWLTTPAASFLHGRFVWANWDADELMALKDKILASPTMLKYGLALE